MAFIDRVSNLSTYTEIKKAIYELNNSEIVEALEALSLDTTGKRKERCSRLRKGIKLLKGMPPRASDYTSLLVIWLPQLVV